MPPRPPVQEGCWRASPLQSNDVCLGQLRKRGGVGAFTDVKECSRVDRADLVLVTVPFRKKGRT